MALRKQRIKNQAYGLPDALTSLAPEPIMSSVAPTATDSAEKGQMVVTDANTVHIYAGKTAGTTTGIWYNLASGVGNFTDATATVSLTTPLVTNDSADLQITTTTTGDVIVNAVDSLTVAAGDTSSVTVTGGDLTLQTVGKSILITADEGVADAIKLDASHADGGIELEAGIGGVYVNTPFATFYKTTDTTVTDTATINANVGVATYTGQTTAAAASLVMKVTNPICTVTSAILCSVSTKGVNDAQMTVTRVVPKAGSFEVTAVNNGAAAVNGDLILTFFIL